MILIGRIRDSAGQHFSNRDRRGAGWRRVERRNGGITRGCEQIGGERKGGGGGQQGEMEGWKIKRERDDGKID